MCIATACGGCAALCGGSPTKLSGFGTVSEIFVQYFIPQMKVTVDFPNYAENLQNSPILCRLTFSWYFP